MLDSPIHSGADLFITIFIIAVAVVAGVIVLDVLRSQKPAEREGGKEKPKGVVPTTEEEL